MSAFWPSALARARAVRVTSMVKAGLSPFCEEPLRCRMTPYLIYDRKIYNIKRLSTSDNLES